MFDTESLREESERRPPIPRVAFALDYYRHLKKLHDYVLENPHKPLQLAEIASHVGISASRLSRLFHEKTGIPFSLWIRTERIARAEGLLCGSDMPISEIAISVGFNNSRTFERTFKQLRSITPSDFRKQKQAQQTSH
ncbi:MAG: helix-turn-helix domain-containing protein [Woeseiaceae bacterium]